MPNMIIIRGVSGSGKTTVAKAMSASLEGNPTVVEADMFFLDKDGVYQFDATQLKKAHGWCYGKVKSILDAGHDVIVSNTFTRKWEIEPYMCLATFYGANVQLISVESGFKNVHGVPDEVVQKQIERFESISLSDFN